MHGIDSHRGGPVTGAEVRIVNRSPERAEALAADLGPSVRVMTADDAFDGAALVINALSVAPSIDFDRIASGTVVMDMTYKPLATPFLTAARKRGLPTVDGLAMLIGQAAPSFEALFRRPPPLPAAAAPVVAEEAKPAAAERDDAGTVVGAMQSSNAVHAEQALAVGGVKAVPAVRAMARKLGVDLSRVAATGTDGAVTMADVKQAAADGSAAMGSARAAVHPSPAGGTAAGGDGNAASSRASSPAGGRRVDADRTDSPDRSPTLTFAPQRSIGENGGLPAPLSPAFRPANPSCAVRHPTQDSS